MKCCRMMYELKYTPILFPSTLLTLDVQDPVDLVYRTPVHFNLTKS